MARSDPRSRRPPFPLPGEGPDHSEADRQATGFGAPPFRPRSWADHLAETWAAMAADADTPAAPVPGAPAVPAPGRAPVPQLAALAPAAAPGFSAPDLRTDAGPDATALLPPSLDRIFAAPLAFGPDALVRQARLAVRARELGIDPDAAIEALANPVAAAPPVQLAQRGADAPATWSDVRPPRAPIAKGGPDHGSDAGSALLELGLRSGFAVGDALVGLPWARAFFRHYREGSWDTWKLSRADIEGEPTLGPAIEENRLRFARRTLLDLDAGSNVGAANLATLTRLQPGASVTLVSDHWKQDVTPDDHRAIGNLDGRLAIGHAEIRSVGPLEAHRDGDLIRVTGWIEHQLKDHYDFKRGTWLATLTTPLERYRRARPFAVRAAWAEKVTIEIPIGPSGLGQPVITGVEPYADVSAEGP